MDTNNDRIKYLQEKLNQLGAAVQEKGLEGKYLRMAARIQRGKLKADPVSEEEWDLMLAAEREKHLLAYYHTVRTELHAMKLAATEQSRTGKLREWLENPWVKVGLTTLALTEVAIKVVEAAHQSGLFFKDDDDTDFLA
ncbi:MAG: hypothetical protein M3416_10375 [Acidobacteriota bacterium]|nr:hypothetical protein [Acidobacteriota bacterium]